MRSDYWKTKHEAGFDFHLGPLDINVALDTGYEPTIFEYHFTVQVSKWSWNFWWAPFKKDAR